MFRSLFGPGQLCWGHQNHSTLAYTSSRATPDTKGNFAARQEQRTPIRTDRLTPRRPMIEIMERAIAPLPRTPQRTAPNRMLTRDCFSTGVMDPGIVYTILIASGTASLRSTS